MRLFQHIVAITGPGISMLPDYMTEERWQEKLNIAKQEENPESVEETLNYFRSVVKEAAPPDVVAILADHPEISIITTNIDGMHRKAGSSNVIELYGNIWEDNVVLYGGAPRDYIKAWKIVNMIPNNGQNALLLIGFYGDTIYQFNHVRQLALDAQQKGFYVKQIKESYNHKTEEFLKWAYGEDDGEK